MSNEQINALSDFLNGGGRFLICLLPIIIPVSPFILAEGIYRLSKMRGSK